jgi:hypothetical protein
MSLHTLPTFKVPFDPLTPLDPNEEPTPAAIHKLIAEVYANAGAVRTDLGGGQQGHLGLVMPEAEYLALPGAEPYEFPVQRPDIPDYSNAGNEAERDQWTKLYGNENCQYSEAQGLNLPLKAQLIQAVPIIYISTLQHPVFMFTNVSVLRILTFLKANYGAISTDNLGTNQEKLMAPWDPNTPIQTVFTTGEACRHFAADAMYIWYLVQKFQSSGVFAK